MGIAYPCALPRKRKPPEAAASIPITRPPGSSGPPESPDRNGVVVSISPGSVNGSPSIPLTVIDCPSPVTLPLFVVSSPSPAVSDGLHAVSDLDGVRVARPHRRETLGVAKLEQRYVLGDAVTGHRRRVCPAARGDRDADRAGAADDVVVRQHLPRGREHDPRAGTGSSAVGESRVDDTTPVFAALGAASEDELAASIAATTAPTIATLTR